MTDDRKRAALELARKIVAHPAYDADPDADDFGIYHETLGMIEAPCVNRLATLAVEQAAEIERLRAIVERSNAKMQDGQWKTAGDEVFHPQYGTSRWFVSVGLRTARTYLGMEEWDTRNIGDFYSTREAAEAAMKESKP